ncbi:MAG: porin family protein [Gammaproteobacteria bacterium]|nr:porin family protein [Gammaproteobacteria bacterium]
MKKILLVSAVAALGLNSVVLAGGLPEEMPMAPAAVSNDSGIYLGIEGGFGMTNWKDRVEVSIQDTSNDSGVVGRAFLGYDINKYFALETGYTYFFNKAKLKTNGAETDNVKTQAIDLMGKIKAPIVDKFDLYAKLGANYLMSRKDNTKNRNNFNVAYGAGADYYITPNVVVDIEWLRFNGHTKHLDGKYQPYADAFMVGLRYKFDM